MTPAAMGTLALLALVDSLSFGTLLIPIWLLMTPGRVRIARVLAFLLTVAGAYFAIGLGLLLGSSALADTFASLASNRSFLWVQLAAGVALVALSQAMDTTSSRRRAAERVATGDSRVSRWRARAMGDGTAAAAPLAALLALAITAVLAEVATMVPYLAAIGIITTEGSGWPDKFALVAGYCLVMVTPALALTIGRVIARAALEGPLGRLDRWLTKHAQSTTAWVIGAVGVIIALRAVSALGLLAR